MRREPATAGRTLCVRLKHVDSSRDQQHEHEQRNQGLSHGKKFRPARQNQRIGRGKRRARVEGNKQLIDKARRPVLGSHRFSFFALDLQLGKQKTSARVRDALMPNRWTSTIKSPVPQSERENVRAP